MKILGKSLTSGNWKEKVENFELNFSVVQKDGYEVKIEVVNLSDSPVFLKEIKIGEIEPSERLFVNNFQSWGPCTFVKPAKMFQFLKAIPMVGFGTSPVPWEFSDGIVSDYFIATDKEFAGFLSSKITHPYFKWHDEIVDVKIHVGKNLKPHEKIELETLWINVFDDLERTLDIYAQKVAELNHPKKSKPFFGWESWYSYYLNISEKALLGELEKVSNFGIKYEVFQIDDGYEADIGEWLKTNDKFPSGLEFIAEKIKGTGIIPGIWTAPFSVSESSELFKDHKDWLVKDDKGPIVAYENWNKKIYALDLSNPKVLDWIGGLFSTLKGYGYDFFKIDFLFAGMIPGKRYLDVTPTEAYRMGMERISNVLGNSHILGCGAPLFPSIGYVDSMRIGADTSPKWNGEIDTGIAGAKYSIRNAFTRNFMGAWWINDPDCVMARSTDTELTKNERMVNVYVPALLNGQFLESDFLDKLTDEDLHFFTGALNFRKGKAQVHFMDEERYIVITHNSMNGDIISFVNLSDSPWGDEIENYRNFLEKKDDEFFVIYPSMKYLKGSIEIEPHSIVIIMHRGKRVLRRDDEKEDDGRDIHYYWGEEYDGTSTQSYNR